MKQRTIKKHEHMENKIKFHSFLKGRRVYLYDVNWKYGIICTARPKKNMKHLALTMSQMKTIRELRLLMEEV